MRKSVGLIVWVLFAIVSGAAVESSAATKIKVGYIVDINMVPFFVAMEKGMFAKRDLDIEALEYISGNDAYTALKGGAMVIFQNMGANALAKFSSQGIPILMTRVWTLPHFKILVHKDATYKDIKELKGESFAVTSYAGTTYALSSMVFGAIGMDPKKDLEVKTFPPAVMTVQLTRKDVASGILWEPLVTKALETNELKVLADPGQLYIDLFKKRFFHGAVGCLKDFFDQNRQAVRAYSDAINEAIQYTLEHKDEANKIMAEKFKGYTAQQIGQIRESWGDGWIKGDIDQNQIDEMQFMYDKFVELTDFFQTKPVAAQIMIKP